MRGSSACAIPPTNLKHAADLLQDTVFIRQHIVIPKPQNAKSSALEASRSRGIAFIFGMLPTIEFDDQLRILA